MRRSSLAVSNRAIAAPKRPGRRRLRTTVGDLVAAAYDLLGPQVSEEEVAELLHRLGRRTATRPRLRIATTADPRACGWCAARNLWAAADGE